MRTTVTLKASSLRASEQPCLPQPLSFPGLTWKSEATSLYSFAPCLVLSPSIYPQKSFQCFRHTHHRYHEKSRPGPVLNGLFVLGWNLSTSISGVHRLSHHLTCLAPTITGAWRVKNARISFYCRDIIHSWEGSKVHASTYVIRVKQSGMQNPSQIASMEGSGGRAEEQGGRKILFRAYSGSLHPSARGGQKVKDPLWEHYPEQREPKLSCARFTVVSPASCPATCRWVSHPLTILPQSPKHASNIYQQAHKYTQTSTIIALDAINKL